GGSTGGADVRIIFSSARESADRVITRMAAQGGAVVSDDREVLRAAARVGAVAITAREFLARLDVVEAGAARAVRGTEDADDESEPRAAPRKGNPRRLRKKTRAAARALGRLGGHPR